MQPILCVEEVRRLEDLIEKEGTSKAELMEHAGEYVASVVSELKPKRVAVLCGFGNNGGDGWVAADILSHDGIAVDVVTPIEPDEIRSALARHVARRTAARDVTVHAGPSRDELAEIVSRADVVVDALLGTGFHGSLRPPFSIWIDVLNELAPTIVSVDVPSGLDSDTGEVADKCVSADRTATMLAPKLGLYSAGGPHYAGEISCGTLYEHVDEVLNDVDHAAEKLDLADMVEYAEPLPGNIDKYSRGSVLVVAGSATYPGAAIMAAKAAARAGAGYVTVAAPDMCANLIRMALPSIPVVALPSDARGAFSSVAAPSIGKLARKYDCVLCGPGMTTGAGCVQVTSELIDSNVPLVLDADALNCLSKLSAGKLDDFPEIYRRDAPLVLTPHYRELSRLLDGTEIEHLASAIEGAQRILWASGSSDMVIVAKGPTTAVVSVERTLLPLSGPASLATAGSGDVLGGIIAGTIACTHGEVDVWEKLVSYAVTLHSLSGFVAASKFGEKSVIATDLIDVIGDAMNAFVTAALEEMGVANEGQEV